MLGLRESDIEAGWLGSVAAGGHLFADIICQMEITILGYLKWYKIYLDVKGHHFSPRFSLPKCSSYRPSRAPPRPQQEP